MCTIFTKHGTLLPSKDFCQLFSLKRNHCHVAWNWIVDGLWGTEWVVYEDFDCLWRFWLLALSIIHFSLLTTASFLGLNFSPTVDQVPVCLGIFCTMTFHFLQEENLIHWFFSLHSLLYFVLKLLVSMAMYSRWNIVTSLELYLTGAPAFSHRMGVCWWGLQASCRCPGDTVSHLSFSFWFKAENGFKRVTLKCAVLRWLSS